MKVSTQRAIDRWVGGLLCGVVSLRARLWPRREPDGAPRHILVILLSEMGSLVLARPMFDFLRERYPEATFHAMVFAQNREILDLQGVVGAANVHTLRNDSVRHLLKDARRATRALRALPLDVAIDCELFARVGALLSWASGAPIRVGFDPHTQEGLYRGRLVNRPVPYNPTQHIAHQFVTLAAAIEAEGRPRVKRIVPERPPGLAHLPLPEADVRALRDRLLADHPTVAGRPLVLLSPAGGLLPIRAWPLASWVALGRALLDDGMALGVIGLGRDRDLARALLGQLGAEPAVDLTGWTRSVREVLLLFHSAALLVANDGGPGHFAALTPMPAVVLFGPETSRLYGALGDRAVNLETNLACSPCLTAYNHRNSPCDGNNVCLQSLEPSRILEVARRLRAAYPRAPLPTGRKDVEREAEAGRISRMNTANIGTEDRPLRVAVVGAGPSGFYIVQGLLQSKDVVATVDLFDRLPSPYGLVRYGVAPDHQKIKNVTKVYDKLASDDRVRYFGGVEVGKDVTLEELEKHYDAVAFCSGAQSDRRLGIPGEDLVGSHPATAFVAWYNGHPDFKDLTFELDAERAVVVGVGNVALDVARILCRTPEELEKTDIAEHALEALRHSKVREVVVLGRRGPAQAAFSNKELDELAKMEGANIRTVPGEAVLDELSRKDLAEGGDRQLQAKVERIESYTSEPDAADLKPKTMWLRFLVSPTELLADEVGRVAKVEIVKNKLARQDDGSLRPRPTDEKEEIEAGLLFRSVGYRGVPIPGVPFREDWGTIPNESGRILEAPGGAQRPKLYVAGWIKRGPSGVIGTNRPDSLETVKAMIEDLGTGALPAAVEPDPKAVVDLLEKRGVRWITFEDWKRLDAKEVARGEALGRPRVKFVSRQEVLDALKD